MLRDELKLASAIATPVFEVLETLGADVRAGLAASRAAPMIDGTLADDVMAGAALRTGDPALGITIARRIPLGGLGLVDHALCTSSTLGDGLARLSKHYGVATERVRMTLDLVEPDATIWLARRPESPPHPHWIEFSLAAVVLRLRACVGPDFALSRVALMHAAPEDRRAQDAFFGVRVEFGAPRDEIVFASRYLHAPLRTRMPCVVEVLDAQMAAITGPTAGQNGVGPHFPRESKGSDPILSDFYVSRVRRAVVDGLHAGHPVRIDRVAAQLGTSARTIQRELHRRGASLAAIVDDVRRELALHALSSGNATVASVAKRLGFAEPSALFRAVRRWTGESPSSFRTKAAQSAEA